MKLYVGNLSFDTTENDLQDAFEKFGTVSETAILMDHGTGRSRGFGFVTMGSSSEGQAAITGLNGKELAGRSLTVNEARPRTEGGAGGGSRDKFAGGGQKRSFSGARRY